MTDRIPQSQEPLYLMEQVELVHDIDEAKRKRKRKRKKQEKKMKKASPPQKKSCVPLETMEGLTKEEEEPLKDNVPSEYKVLEEEFVIKERQKERSSIEHIYKKKCNFVSLKG